MACRLRAGAPGHGRPPATRGHAPLSAEPPLYAEPAACTAPAVRVALL